MSRRHRLEGDGRGPSACSAYSVATPSRLGTVAVPGITGTRRGAAECSPLRARLTSATSRPRPRNCRAFRSGRGSVLAVPFLRRSRCQPQVPGELPRPLGADQVDDLCRVADLRCRDDGASPGGVHPGTVRLGDEGLHLRWRRDERGSGVGGPAGAGGEQFLAGQPAHRLYLLPRISTTHDTPDPGRSTPEIREATRRWPLEAYAAA
jgi:hypothetical protein